MIKTNRSYKPCFVCYRMTLSKYRHCTSCGGAKISKRVWARKNNGKKESYPEPWKSSVITLKDEVKRELRHQYNELVEPHKLAFYRNLSENELKLVFDELEKYNSLERDLYKEKLINRYIELDKISEEIKRRNIEFDKIPKGINTNETISQFRKGEISEEGFKEIIEATEDCHLAMAHLEKKKKEKGLI